jgi:hypothetical protein
MNTEPKTAEEWMDIHKELDDDGEPEKEQYVVDQIRELLLKDEVRNCDAVDAKKLIDALVVEQINKLCRKQAKDKEASNMQRFKDLIWVQSWLRELVEKK